MFNFFLSRLLTFVPTFIGVTLISFSFMLLFTAFQSMANLQSSINKVGSSYKHSTRSF